MSTLLWSERICCALGPVVTLKSVRSAASCASQYSLFDSIQSIFPYLYEKNATALNTLG